MLIRRMLMASKERWKEDGKWRWTNCPPSPSGHIFSSELMWPLLLSGELLSECCRTDDLMPSIPVLCLPPSRVDPKVLGLNVLIYHSQPGGSWTTRRSPPVGWWLQRGGDDTVVVTGPPLELIEPGVATPGKLPGK